MKDNEKIMTEIAEEFGGAAGKTILLESFGKQIIETELILKEFKEGSDFRALDIGGGLGTNFMAVRKILGSKPKLYLIDKFEEYTPDNSMGGKERGFELMKKNDISFIFQDFWENQKLPFENKSFDVVTIFDTIEHLPGNPIGLLREARRILRDGGKIIVSIPNSISIIKRVKLLFGKHPYIPFELWISEKYYSHYREYSRKEDIELLERSGFRDVIATGVSEPTKTRISKMALGTKKFGYFSPVLWLLLVLYAIELLNEDLRPVVYCVAKA
jgi:ubiquinone/menaquinone biosynthesis C-methylase UbiE